MSDAGQSVADRVFVALGNRYALAKVEGRGSFKVSASLKQFGESAIAKHIPLLLFDMIRCIGMDSTFMGVLAGLASRLKQHDGSLVLVNCSARTRGLLATLGLDQLVRAFEVGQTPPEYLALLRGASPDQALASGSGQDVQTVTTMLNAHQDLVDLVPENLPQFKDVLVFLRDEVSRKTGENQVGG